MQVKHQVFIQAPRPQVFDLVFDDDKIVLWMEGLESTEYTSERNLADPVGTTFRQRMTEFGRTVEYAGVITNYRVHECLSVSLTHPRFKMNVDYRLHPERTGTTLVYRVTLVESDGMVGKLSKMMGWYLKKVATSQLDKIKKLAESMPYDT
jgi:uncharacterized protein YndB with AHSA1/START domain